MNSQAGRKSSGLTWDTKKPYESNERAYFEGFMLEDKAAKFIETLTITTDKNAIILPAVEKDIPRKFDIPLTIVSVDGGKPEVHTHMATVLPKEVWEFYRKQTHINKTEKVVYIFCWDPKWGRNASGKSGLFTDVLATLKTI